jgi:hypothetical protein
VFSEAAQSKLQLTRGPVPQLAKGWVEANRRRVNGMFWFTMQYKRAIELWRLLMEREGKCGQSEQKRAFCSRGGGVWENVCADGWPQSVGREYRSGGEASVNVRSLRSNRPFLAGARGVLATRASIHQLGER